MLTTNRAKPWYHVGARILGDMFTPQALKGKRPDQIVYWCKTCGSDTEHKKEFRYEGKVYAKKEWCACCGTVINWSVFGGDEAEEFTRVRARLWATSPELDRR